MSKRTFTLSPMRNHTKYLLNNRHQVSAALFSSLLGYQLIGTPIRFKLKRHTKKTAPPPKTSFVLHCRRPQPYNYCTQYSVIVPGFDSPKWCSMFQNVMGIRMKDGETRIYTFELVT